MIKILIIGKTSFLSTNLNINLSKYFSVHTIRYKDVIKKNINFFHKFSHVINTCIHKNYVKKKYNKNYDLDKKFILNLKNINFIYIFFNTRKIYLPKENITENTRLMPINNYAKNKVKTEKFLIDKLGKKILSLRVGNIIGKRIKKSKKYHHQLFIDNFLNYKKKKKKIKVANDFKDFLTITQFSKIMKLVIEKKITGIFNVSISKKIYISEIINWLDPNFIKYIEFTDSNSDSFTLSNKKLINKINIKLTKNELKIFCQNLF